VRMQATPDISHLTVKDFNNVYEPAEDTFLLMDALEADKTTLLNLKPIVCLEVGSGSGAVSTFLAQMIGPESVYLCTDINVDAAVATQRTGDKNGVILLPVVTDLVVSVIDRLTGSVDVLLCNPPYVVTSSTEIGSQGIEAAWAGGLKGREVMDRLFPFVPQLLSSRGVFYLVIIKENDIDEIAWMMSKHKMNMTIILQRRSGPEYLSVLRFTRTTQQQQQRTCDTADIIHT